MTLGELCQMEHQFSEDQLEIFLLLSMVKNYLSILVRSKEILNVHGDGFAELPAGVFWLATSNGLRRIQGDTWYDLTETDGLPRIVSGVS